MEGETVGEARGREWNECAASSGYAQTRKSCWYVLRPDFVQRTDSAETRVYAPNGRHGCG